MFSRTIGARPWKLSSPERTAGRRETSAESGTDSFAHSRDRVSVLKSGPPRTGHEFSWPERFVFAVITINLPASEAAAGIDNFPARASENALHFRRGSFENQPAPERS